RSCSWERDSSPGRHPTSGRDPDLGPGGRIVAARPSIIELADHFVARSPELQQLDDALDEVGNGGARAIEVVGAAGIGKTRLLGELAAHADARGHIVLRGSGADLERDLAFWVFV